MTMNKFKPEHFRWEDEGHVGIVTLNRPERKNPLTFESYAELRDIFRTLNQDSDIKSVVITGEGGNFCSGGDVRDIIGELVTFEATKLRDFTHMTGDLVKAMRACPQPIIAAVDGVCAGAGAAIAMASDLRFGTLASRVAFLFVKVGLAGCDMGACAMLPRLIGHGRAADLLFTGRTMTGEEGERWGFFNRLTQPEILHDITLKTAHELADGPTLAHTTTKDMLNREWNMGLIEAIDAEADAQAACMQTQDFSRAYNAFIEKRAPVFEGD